MRLRGVSAVRYGRGGGVSAGAAWAGPSLRACWRSRTRRTSQSGVLGSRERPDVRWKSKPCISTFLCIRKSGVVSRLLCGTGPISGRRGKRAAKRLQKAQVGRGAVWVRRRQRAWGAAHDPQKPDGPAALGRPRSTTPDFWDAAGPCPPPADKPRNPSLPSPTRAREGWAGWGCGVCRKSGVCRAVTLLPWRRRGRCRTQRRAHGGSPCRCP